MPLSEEASRAGFLCVRELLIDVLNMRVSIARRFAVPSKSMSCVSLLLIEAEDSISMSVQHPVDPGHIDREAHHERIESLNGRLKVSLQLGYHLHSNIGAAPGRWRERGCDP